MPYTLVYEQDWSAGNSHFTAVDYYSAASDPLYPEMKEAEGVTVNTGNGPSGENTLDWSGTYADYGVAGVWLHLPTVASAGTGITDMGRGKAEIWYKPNATSLDDSQFGAPLLYLRTGTGGNAPLSWLRLLNYLQSGSTWTASVGYQETLEGVATWATSYTYTPSAGSGEQWVMEWGIGSGDGWITVTRNGSAVYTLTGLTLADPGAIRAAYIGFHGLYGETTNFRLYRWSDVEPSVPQPDNSVWCPPACGSGSGPGIPSVVLPVLAPTSCVGGGLVPVLSALTDPESWWGH
jgi:hypothetical protein